MPPTDFPWNTRELHIPHPDSHVFRISKGIECEEGVTKKSFPEIAERKSYAFPSGPHNLSAAAPFSMFRISRTFPAYFFTCVTHKRLPIFRTDRLKQVLCDAYREACERHGISILSYVIMHDHVHLLVYSERKMEEVLRLLNGVAARRIIGHLKENGFESSLFKLRGEVRERNHRHSVWQHHPDSLEIFGEETFKQKVNYIHQNPVRANWLVTQPNIDSLSARLWLNRPLTDEPLTTAHHLIDWRTAA